MKFIYKYYNIVLITFTIFFLIYLPYYIFEGKLFVGGDDTKLMYVFPYEYLSHMAFYSWTHISSVGAFNPNQHAIPLTFLLTQIQNLIKNKTVIDYAVFSAPLIMGFIFFRLFVRELWSDIRSGELYIGALFYILSPIILVDQLSIFLYSVWLIGLIPLLLYYCIRFIKTGSLIFIYIPIIFTVIFSIGLYSIPWSFAFLLTFVISSLIIIPFYSFAILKIVVKRILVFLGILLLVHSFWLLPFISTFLIRSNSNIGSQVLSVGIFNTFRSTVISTATGNILYPLLNLFHRQIAFDFEWQLKTVFLHYYDKTFWINGIYIIILFFSLLSYREIKNKSSRKKYIFSLIAFVISLFFFTVNIGPLKEVFFLMGNLPGFVMFRNFYDKFSITYIFFYGTFFTISLSVILQKRLRLRRILLPFIFFVVMVNILPIKQIVNSPLWTSKNSLRSIQFPEEYAHFMKDVMETVDPSTTLLSLPLNIAAYSVVRENGTDNVYAGTSPVKILTGINDFSGDMSFKPSDTDKINEYIRNKNYASLNTLLSQYNIGYLIVNNNIPTQVKKSYLYQSGYKLIGQDQNLINGITDAKLLTSKQGSLELYSIKNREFLFNGNDITFKKLSPIHYELYIHNVKNAQELQFKDTYNSGWKLFIEPYHADCIPRLNEGRIHECKPDMGLMSMQEFSYLFKPSLFDKSHTLSSTFGNKWTISSEELTKRYNQSYFHTNKDGSLNLKINLYFVPQLIFYIGIVLSSVTLIIMTILTLTQRYRKKI